MRRTPAGPDRWSRLWTRLGGDGDGLVVYQELVTAYSDPARAYHTVAHIADCLDQLDLHRNLALKPDEVEAALWFHDAVYEPLALDNEDRSAGLAEQALMSGGVKPEVARRVAELIRATRHTTIPQGQDARLICDIDLSILGRNPSRFEEFEHQIRQEYAEVPRPLYRAGRSRILSGFLHRSSIYQTPAFTAEYESQARRNIESALVRLSS